MTDVRPDHQPDADDGLQVLKLARLHQMITRLLDELHTSTLDAPSSRRVQELANRTLVQVGSAVPDPLLEELGRIASPLEPGDHSQAELRITQAQLLGWLTGIARSEKLDTLRELLDQQQLLVHDAEEAHLHRNGSSAYL